MSRYFLKSSATCTAVFGLLSFLPITPYVLADETTISTVVTSPDGNSIAHGRIVNVVEGGVWNLRSSWHYAALYFQDGTLNVNGGTVTNAGSPVDGVRIGIGTNANANLIIRNGGSFTANGFFTIADSGVTSILIDGPTSILNGTPSVRNGKLAITLANGGTWNGALTMASNTTLNGSGNIGALTSVAGSIVRPEGTLNVKGDYQSRTGSVLQMSGADHLAVDGRAVIAAGAQLHVINNADVQYVLGHRVALLTATGGVAGQFDVFSTPSLFFTLVPSYDANALYLTAEKNRSFADVTGTTNQQNTAAALDRLTPDNALVTAVLNTPTEAAARAAFSQLSGELQASVPTAMIQDSRYVRDAANARLRCGLTTQGCTAGEERDGVWLRTFGASGRLEGNTGTADLAHGTHGVLIGVDRLFSDWRIGALTGVGRSDFDLRAYDADGTSDNHYMGIYGGRSWQQLSLRTGLSHSHQRVNTARRVNVTSLQERLHAGYAVDTTQAFAELSYGLEYGRVLAEPLLNVAQVRQQTERYRERGGSAALQVSSPIRHTTLVTPGLRVSSAFMLADMPVTASSSVGWQMASGDRMSTATMQFANGPSFEIKGAGIAPSTGFAQAGLGLALNRSTALELNYQRSIDSTRSEQSAGLTLAVGF